MTLTEFLLARIAEDEERGGCNGPDSSCDRQFERVLAECEAKRRIVALHTPVDDEPDGWCNRCDGDGWPCGTMAAIALPYADHPDYRDEWKP